MTDPDWCTPFSSDETGVVFDAVGDAVAEAIEPNEAARAAAIAEALNGYYRPWQPPEEPGDDFVCLGWCHSGWRRVLWDDDGWHTVGFGQVWPSDFLPMPPPPSKGEME